MLVACLGDVMLDVIVETPGALVPTTTTPRPGSRSRPAARPPTSPPGWWPSAGEHACSVPGPTPAPDTWWSRPSPATASRSGAPPTGRTGAVVSLVTGGTRSMASDPGDLSWLDDVRVRRLAGRARTGCSCPATHCCARRDQQRVVETAAVARAHGTRIALDLSSAAMVADFGADAFSDLCRALRPAVVFATDGEWATSPGAFGAGDSAVLVLKHGGRGATFVSEDESDDRPPTPGRSST